ncbi:MAG: hypothetical protein MJ252_04645, partial [archaeon]|nr:hypothetical protein [archaeon]
LIIIDIIIQIVAQIPVINKFYDDYISYFITIGINRLITMYDNQKKIIEHMNFVIEWERVIPVIFKAIVYFIMSFQVVIFSSADFQEFYLGYIITKNDKARKSALINVFFFNNERVKEMKESLKRRSEMRKTMEDLQRVLSEWDDKLGLLISDEKEEIKKKKQIGDGKESKEEKKEESKESPKEEEKKEESKEEGKLKLFGSEIQEEEIKVEEEKDKATEEKQIKENIDLLTDSWKFEPGTEVYKEKIARYMVKKILMNKFLLKIYTLFDMNYISVNSLEKNDKEAFIKELIQGRYHKTSLIERMVDSALDSLDLTGITKPEMNLIKEILIQGGTRDQIEFQKKLQLKKEKSKKEEKKKEKKEEKKDEEEPEEEDIFSQSIKGSKADYFKKILSGQVVEANQEEEFTEERMQQNAKLQEDLAAKKAEEERKAKEEEEKLLKSPKVLQFKRLVKKKIYTRYLTNTFIFLKLIQQIIYNCLSNSRYIVFLLMILNHYKYASLISLFYPLSVFLFGMLDYPRPRKSYWNAMTIYTTIVIILKFIIQFQCFKNMEGYQNLMLSLKRFKIGLEYIEDTFSNEFLHYIIFDILVLFALLIHQFILIKIGLWEFKEQDVENIEEANERIFETKNQEIFDNEAFNEEYLEAAGKKSAALKTIGRRGSFASSNTLATIGSMQRAIEETKSKQKPYFSELFPKIRNEKPGADFYPFFTIIMLFNLAYIVIFFTNMMNDYSFDAVSVETSQFSGSMVIFLFIHVAFMVIDRVIYLKQNRNHLEYDYVLFEKSTGKKMPNEDYLQLKKQILEEVPELKNKPFSIPLNYKYKLEKLYNIVTIQKEETNYPLICKYILNFIIVIMSHFVLFFYLPMKGNQLAYNQIYCPDKDSEENPLKYCNDFTKKWHLRVSYILYIIYLFFSCQQIKNGYRDLRRKSVLKAGDSVIYSTINSVVKAVPFFYELKLAIDWTFTETCLSLFQWNKFESIYTQLFITLCSMKAVNKSPVARRVGIGLKAGMGGLLFFGVLLLLIGPLLIYSDLNPTNDFNNVTGGYVRLDLCFVEKDLAKNYTLFINDHVNKIENITDEVWKAYEYDKKAETKHFEKKQVQIIEMNTISDTSWTIPEPKRVQIVKDLQNYKENTNLQAITIGFRYKFQRPIPKEETERSLKSFDLTLYDVTQNITNETAIDILTKAFDERENGTISFEQGLDPAVKLTADPHPKRKVQDKSEIKRYQTNIFFNFSKTVNSDAYFGLTLNRPDKGGKEEGVVFHTFSDKVFTLVSSANVISFYVTIVLVAGNYFKGFFAGEAERVMLTEMPHPEYLVNLCEGVLISRYSFDLLQEEHLYYVLIEFMRSPEYLKIITQSSIKQFQTRKNEIKATSDDL